MNKVLLLLLCALFSVPGYSKDRLLLKNYRELYASYASATGVSPQDAEVRDSLRLNMERLPKRGDTDELSSPVILAATELSGLFCNKAIEREKVQSPGERVLFSAVDFQAGPVQFSDYLGETIASDLALVFWQRNVTAEESITISEIIREAAAESLFSPADTENILQILCTTYATSLSALVK